MLNVDVFPAGMKPMPQVAQLLQELLSAGVIRDYAVFGAVAQMRYTEAIPTQDADILVALPTHANLGGLQTRRGVCKEA